MNMTEALKTAQKDGQLCIMRNISMTSFRFVQPTNTPWGCLMAEQYGPLQGLTSTIAHWSPSVEDMASDAWRVAPNKQLYYDASISQPEKAQEGTDKYTIDDVISCLCGHVIEDDLNNETLLAMTAGIKTLSEAKNNNFLEIAAIVSAQASKKNKPSYQVGCCCPDSPKDNSNVKESAQNDSEQTTEQ